MSCNSNTLLPRSSRIIPLVLVVDDDYDNLVFITHVLDILNVKHLAANKPKYALDLAKDWQPDLILLDMVMPELDGMQITRLLKANPSTAHIPIIAVTGLTLAKHKSAIEDAGCDDYISKPFLIEELETKIFHYLFDLV
jgi:CheY-like chemotaxis protein